MPARSFSASVRPLLSPFRRAAASEPAAARLAFRLLENIKTGAIEIRLPDNRVRYFGRGEPHAQLRMDNWNVCAASLKNGDVGFAQTYIDGDWHTDDLLALLTVVVKNRAAIEAVVYGSWAGRLLSRLRHLSHGNSRSGSRRNIHAHYDLGNDFYRLWLDPSMTYSAALFDAGSQPGASVETTERAPMTLAEGQLRKYRRLLDAIGVGNGVDHRDESSAGNAAASGRDGGAHLLEIGCGWGAFAEIAARETGAHVTGLTLSREQLDYAQQRVERAGLGRQVDLQLVDYRDVQGQYDAIVSIEMFEAVGERYWPAYFNCVKRALKPGGRAGIQSIVIADALFDRYRQGTDFIQQYVFPGGMLPSINAFQRAAEQAGLKITAQLAFGADYARTLREWRAAFHAQLDTVRAQGFDERFIRTWDFYLCYCETAFANGNTDVVQFTLEHA